MVGITLWNVKVNMIQDLFFRECKDQYQCDRRGKVCPRGRFFRHLFFPLLQKCSVTHRDMGKVITLTFFVVPIIMPANLNFRQRLRVWLSQAWGWDDVSWIRVDVKTILWSKVPTTARNISITSALIVSSVQILSSTASSVLPVSFVFLRKKRKRSCPETDSAPHGKPAVSMIWK